MKKEDYALDVQKSKSLDQTLTKFRKELRDLALEKHKQDALWLEQDINNITVLADRLGRGYFKG